MTRRYARDPELMLREQVQVYLLDMVVSDIGIPQPRTRWAPSGNFTTGEELKIKPFRKTVLRQEQCLSCAE